MKENRQTAQVLLLGRFRPGGLFRQNHLPLKIHFEPRVMPQFLKQILRKSELLISVYRSYPGEIP